MIFHSVALLIVSLTPTWLGLTGNAYLVGALLLGLGVLLLSIDFSRTKSTASARRLMRYSIVYLPAVLAVMVLDRVV